MIEGVPLLDLRDPRAAEPALAGAKAANLARCAIHGLPTVPGFVVTTAATPRLGDRSVRDALFAAWSQLAGENQRAVIVRSSSTGEDTESSSMAGQFVSVAGVVGWEPFLDAVRTVVASAEGARSRVDVARPMAVLVQRQVAVATGGVLFGVDPVSGRRDHLVVEVVRGNLEALVGGEVTAAHYVLSRRGRVVDYPREAMAVRLPGGLRRRLVRLARQAESTLGLAQDIEWAADPGGQLWLLQSRPITAVAEPQVARRVFGTGPVAETFPEPLHALERDVWLQPLKFGIERALTATGAVSPRALADSPVLIAVGGWPAVDLELIGIVAGRRTLKRRLNPVEFLRRTATAWRVGRLRVAIPRLASEVIATVDADLGGIPAVETLSDHGIVQLIERATRELATVHFYEVLAGMLLHNRPNGLPASLVALGALDEGRRIGLDDSQIVARWPVTLALTPPSMSTRPSLPPVAVEPTRPAGALSDLDEREGLRLRGRWVQELIAVAARELAARLVERGVLIAASQIRELDLGELTNVLQSGQLPSDVSERAEQSNGPPLPATFRLTASGGVVSAEDRHRARSGLPAAAGRATGTARHRVAPGTKRDGIVLVTQHLEPTLAPVLSILDGLVAETGSALSHLAILAREVGVPTVVGVRDARRLFPPGTRLLVDGTIGDVQVIREPEPAVSGPAATEAVAS